ncbi:MAG TPA: tetratricopeptide repeat protein [Leptospiraceae bacterium]|nr:tetratricopeptide repeat protein [Leptospiraceae bacterium]HMW07806.1 tetratricopeptide repeat protein [Leptospiraceae bacterium]HMY33509.1 tetratricopeptide repeat protein [Leptospiraceae bacterium]HMZ67344.1 tetratricopeptide repeat protein [Leptospiraceae bacterium]HNA10116.1 tetratricopeptide repeat protein [Leptospiraceae bacterium]
MRILLTLLFISIAGLSAQSMTYEKALAEYKAASYQESLQTIREILKVEKPRYELHYLAAFDYWNLKEYKSAINHFQAAIRLKPDDTKAYIDIVKVYTSAQSYKQALELCEDAIKRFPQEPKLRFQQVTLLLKYGRVDVALEIIEKLKLTLPEDYRPLALESNIYYMKRDFEKAEISLKWASALSPSNANLKNNLALIYEQMAIINLKTNEKEKAKVNLDLAKSQLESAISTNSNPVFLENQKRIVSLSNSL